MFLPSPLGGRVGLGVDTIGKKGINGIGLAIARNCIFPSSPLSDLRSHHDYAGKVTHWILVVFDSYKSSSLLFSPKRFVLGARLGLSQSFS